MLVLSARMPLFEVACQRSFAKHTVAEFTGTCFLIAGIVGSGIMEERLAGGIAAIALLANTLATDAILVDLILAFGNIPERISTLLSRSRTRLSVEFAGATFALTSVRTNLRVPDGNGCCSFNVRAVALFDISSREKRLRSVL